MDRKEYDQMAEELKPANHKMKNGLNAFLYGGVMGIIAQGVLEFYMNVYKCSEKEATPMMIITLVFVACLLTGLGIYDKIASHAGAGTFIPITGFANSMASCALDSKSEGLIMGIGSNMFKLGGTVITYGIVSASLLGVIRYVFTLLGNSLKLENVYIRSAGTTCGVLEHQGPLGMYFDKTYQDYHCGEDSFEKAERKMLRDALDICLQKQDLKHKDVDIYMGGDLLNQITSVHYLARELPRPFVGLYGACSSFALSCAVGSMLIEAGYVDNIMTLVSSHNATAERQYRYPVEYGVQKKATTTFTATGAIATLLSSKPTDVRVESLTLGKVVDYLQNDPNDMGRAMAPAAYDTIMTHFHDLKRSFKDYDLVVTGDLSTYGHLLLKEMLMRQNIEVTHYNDCGCMLYDIKKQEVFQGGSGCACSGLVTMGYLYTMLKEGKYKRILVVATGALLSPMMSAQKESIPCVAHAISLEVVK